MRRLLSASPGFDLESPYELDPQVALRPEPFGALAYHYGTRRLVFLRKPEVVAVVRALADQPCAADALRACAIEERRWPAFAKALASLAESHLIRSREVPDADR